VTIDHFKKWKLFVELDFFSITMVIKTAIVGMGGHARGSWYNELKKHPEFQLMGIVDSDTELLTNVGNWGLSEDQAFMNIDDMVKFGEKPDLAIVATPIYTHHVLVKEIMDLDINVICEKNMASSIYQGRQMVQAALDKPQLCTAIGTQYRYFSHNWTLHQFFKQKDNPIGELAYIRWTGAGNWGEKRSGWRRWIQEIYLEDMCTHYFDLLRYITGMDVVQVKADTFIPKYSAWQGSSTAFVNLALAHKDDYHHRHNWVWVQLYGDWQRRGPGEGSEEFFCAKGQAKRGNFGVELKIYQDDDGHKWEEDGYLPSDAGNVEDCGNYTGQGVILEMMKRGIESKGKKQPGTHFAEAFKSFAVSQAAIESSRTGQTIFVPDYWKNFLD
jgi:predicted dehydrogenase